MGKELKSKITMEGVVEYKNSISSMNNSLAALKSQLKLLDVQSKGNEKSMQTLAQKKEVLNKILQENQAKVNAAAKALTQLKEKGNENAEAIKKAEKELNTFLTAVAQTENELADLDSELNKSKSSFASFGDFAGKAGGKLLNVGKAGAKAFFTGAKVVAGAAAAAGTAITAMAISAGKLADDLLTQSSITRISTDDLQKYKYTLNFIDGDINTLTGSMTKNQQNMFKAIEGNKDLRRTYRNLGISLKDNNGQMRDSNEVFWETIDALRGIENETKREAIAMKLLGKSAKELNPIIEAGSEAFKAMGLEAEAMGLIIGQDSLGKLGEFDDTMNKLKLTAGGLKNTFAIIALPFLQTMADEGLTILSNFNKAMQDSEGDSEKMKTAISGLVGDISTFVTNGLPEFLNMGGEILSALVGGLAQNSEAIGRAIGTFISNVGAAITQHGGAILKDALAGVLSGIFGEDFDTVKAKIEQFGTDIKTGFENLKTGISNAWNGLTSILTAPFTALEGAVKSAIDWVGNLLGLSGSKVEVEFVQTHTSSSGRSHAGGSTTYGHAEGGVFRKPTFFPQANAVVGEAGAEAVLPTRKLFEWMDKRLGAYGRREGVNVQVTQNIYADSTDYYAQQKQAARQLELLLGNL